MRTGIIVACVLLLGLFIVGCNSSTSTTTSTSSVTTTTGGGSSHALVGTWSGTWTDTRYSFTGSLNATITQSGTTLSGTGTIGLTSLGLTTEAGTASGVISGSNVTFSFTSSTVGTGAGTISGDTITGTGNVTGVLGFGAFTFEATVNPSGNAITGSFDFTSASGGWGTAEVTKL